MNLKTDRPGNSTRSHAGIFYPVLIIQQIKRYLRRNQTIQMAGNPGLNGPRATADAVSDMVDPPQGATGASVPNAASCWRSRSSRYSKQWFERDVERRLALLDAQVRGFLERFLGAAHEARAALMCPNRNSTLRRQRPMVRTSLCAMTENDP